MPTERVKKNISLRYRFVGYFNNANDYPSFFVPVILFYSKSHLGMSFSQTILIFYGLGFISSMFEIPAGSFGDKYGRKKSYLLGLSLMFIGFSIWLFVLPIGFYVIGSLCIGIGSAFRSGSISSIIFEEYAIENCAERYHIFQSRSVSFMYALRLISMPLGAYLYTVNELLPIQMTLIFLVLSIVASFFISDKNITPESHNARSIFKKTFKEIFASSEIKTLCLLVFVSAAYGNIIWRLFQPAYSELDLNVKYIGYFYTIFSLAGIVGSLKLGKIIERKKLFRIILIFFVIAMTVYMLASVSFNIYTVTLCVFTVSIFFPVSEAAVSSYLQHKFERYQQATILSVISFLFWFGLNVGDLAAGILNSFFDVERSVLIIAGFGAVLLLLIVPLTLKNMKPGELVVSEN